MHRVLFILGSPNDEFGKLSDIAMKRVDAAEQIYEQDRMVKMLVTGGNGSHFNVAARPHRHYVHRELEARSLPFEALREDDLLSQNTIEDAILIETHVASQGYVAFEIVTSDFHIARCRAIFSCIAPGYSVRFHAARDPDPLDPELQAHEQVSLRQIMEQRGITYANRRYPLPDDQTRAPPLR